MRSCLSRRWRVTAVTLALSAAGIVVPAVTAMPAGNAAIGTVIEPGGESVHALAVDPATHTVWAGITTTGKTDVVAKISETSGRVLARFSVPRRVQAIAVDPTSGTVWVTTTSARLAVTEIVERTSAVRTVSLAKADAGIVGLTVDPRTGLVFVLTANGLVVRITEATRAVKAIAISPNEVGQGGAIGVDPVRGEVWVAGFQISAVATEVLAFSEDGTQLAGPIVLGSAPVLAMAVDPRAGRVWVSDTSGRPEITEIGEAAATVVAGPFMNFKLPLGLAANARTGAIWVIDFGASTVSDVIESKGRAGISGPVPVGSFALSVAADQASGRVFVGGYQLGNGRNVATLTEFSPAAPAFTSPSTVWFAATGGKVATFRITTAGFPAPDFTVSQPPAWLAVNGKTGLLTVTRGPGVHPGATAKIKITAVNGIGTPTEQTLTVNVGSAPVFRSPTRASFRAGKPASFTIRAAGTPAPVITAGKHLPAGLRVARSGQGKAVLSGVPFRSDAGHTYKVRITATSPVGKPVDQTLTIKVS